MVKLSMPETTYRSFQESLKPSLVKDRKKICLDWSLEGQQSIVGTLLNTQTLPACKEGDWTRARVQINNSSLQSLRKISVQQELNSWQQQLLLRKKNRQQLEQVLQLENTEALLKARQAHIRQQCQNIDKLRLFKEIHKYCFTCTSCSKSQYNMWMQQAIETVNNNHIQ